MTLHPVNRPYCTFDVVHPSRLNSCTDRMPVCCHRPHKDLHSEHYTRASPIQQRRYIDLVIELRCAGVLAAAIVEAVVRSVPS